MTTTGLDSYLEAWKRHHDGEPSTLDAMIDTTTDDLVYEDIPTAMVFKGHEGVKAICATSPSWTEDIRLTLVSKQSTEDRWAIEWEAVGTDKASTKPFVFRGSSVGSVDRHGKVNSHRDYWDLTTLLNQVAMTENLPSEVEFRVTLEQANMLLELATRATEGGATSNTDELAQLTTLLESLTHAVHLQQKAG